jgi:hypothetical protein
MKVFKMKVVRLNADHKSLMRLSLTDLCRYTVRKTTRTKAEEGVETALASRSNYGIKLCRGRVGDD